MRWANAQKCLGFLFDPVVLHIKKRMWGDALSTQGAAWRKLGIAVEDHVLHQGRTWAWHQLDDAITAATAATTAAANAADTPLSERQNRRCASAVQLGMDALVLARELVAWVGRADADAAVITKVLQCAAAVNTLLVLQYDGIVCHRSRQAVMSHFEVVLKTVDIVKAYGAAQLIY